MTNTTINSYPAMDKCFDAIAQWEDGTMVIGSSNLTGKYWSGAVWCYKNMEDIPKVDKCVAGVETEAGVCDIVSMGQNKVLIGLDSGVVEVLELEVEPLVPLILIPTFYASEHDDLVSCIDILDSNKTKAVSSSYDFSIKVWDLDAMCSLNTFKPAHGDMVLSVAPCKSNENLFLSCSKDLRLRLWDLRAGNKACIVSTLQANENMKRVVPTSVACQPGSYLYAVGFENGSIKLGDFRSASNPTEEVNNYPVLIPNVAQLNCHRQRIRKLEFSTQRPELLASCANSREVIVHNVSDPAVPVNIYENTGHEQNVRDLLWDLKSHNVLWSSGWGPVVRCHNISGNNSSMDTGDQ